MKKLVLFITPLTMCLLMTACGQAVKSNNSNPIAQTVPVESTIPVATEATATNKVFNSGSEEYSVVLPVYELVKKTTLAGTYEYSDFKYNENGQLIEKKESGLSNGIISYEYDEDGHVISETDTNAYGSEKTEYKYNEHGLLEDTETHKYEYDENGNMVKETMISPEYPDEPLVLEYVYDEAGVLVQEIETWYEGRSISSQYTINKKYDSAGRLVQEAVEDVIDNDKWLNTYEYAVVSSYSISSASDHTLIPATKWQSFSEIAEIPLPDTCITDIHFETREDNGSAIIYMFTLPIEREDANTAYYKYQSILADVCELTLDTKDDMVYISSNGELLSLMMAGNDEHYGNFVQISFQAGEKPQNSNETRQKETQESVSSGMRNALKAAKNYLSVMAFSYSGLVEQLEYEGYSNSEATYAADNCGADWYEQAVKSAKQYLDVMAFSRSGLIDQLEYEGYTHDQAVYGVDKAY